MIRWPGVIKPGTVINDFGAHEDMIPTLLAAAGDTTVKEDLLKGKKIGDMTYKVHLDGYNLLPFFKGEAKEWPRREFIYWTDGGSVAALRYNNWKLSFLRQNSVGIKVWESPFEELRWPMLTNLRMDPFERASDESIRAPAMVRGTHVRAGAGRRLCRRNGCRASASSRRARSPAASASTA